MSSALITTVPFGDKNRLPFELLEEAGIEYLINPLGRKLTEQELADIIPGFEVLISGTEPITNHVMQRGKNLKMISRVGIGLDSVDLLAAERRGIKVSYTPDAPSPAVAELTLGLMLSLLRSTHLSNLRMHNSSSKDCRLRAQRSTLLWCQTVVVLSDFWKVNCRARLFWSLLRRNIVKPMWGCLARKPFSRTAP